MPWISQPHRGIVWELVSTHQPELTREEIERSWQYALRSLEAPEYRTRPEVEVVLLRTAPAAFRSNFGSADFPAISGRAERVTFRANRIRNDFGAARRVQPIPGAMPAAPRFTCSADLCQEVAAFVCGCSACIDNGRQGRRTTDGI